MNDKLITKYIQLSVLSLTTIVPFALLTLPLRIKPVIKDIPTPFLYTLFLLIVLYSQTAIYNQDIVLGIMAATLLILPLYLINNANEQFYKTLIIGVIILELFIAYDFISHAILHNEFKRASGLHHNAFYAAQTLIYLYLILNYRSLINHKRQYFNMGVILATTFTRTSIILPLMLLNWRKASLVVIGALIVITFTTFTEKYIFTESTVIENRISQKSTITNRAAIITEHEYKLFSGGGLNQSYDLYLTNQLPHNIFLAASVQLGIVIGVSLVLLIYSIYFYYGYKYGYWKIIPLIIFDQIDGSILNNYVVLSITIIYLFAMAKRPTNMYIKCDNVHNSNSDKTTP